MSELYEPRLRPERLIAGGRVALAAASLFAVWFDVDEPVRFVTLAYSVLVGYLIHATAIAAILWRVETVPRHWPVITHVIDLACFSVLIYCTEGPSSPFTVLFVFALLGATLRWRVRGTLWTAAVVVSTFLAFGAYFALYLDDPDFDSRALIIRSVYLIVLAVLLRYVGTQDQRTLREMWGLAAWPPTLATDANALARDLVPYAARLMDASRVVLGWSDRQSSEWHLASWSRDSWTFERLPTARPLVRGELRDRAFIRGRPAGRTLMQDPGSPHLSTWHADPLDADFSDRFGAVPVLSVPVRGERVEGHLLVLDRHDATLDDLVLAEVVASVIASRLDAFSLAAQLRQGAATEERIRLARDLHDGVLQSFTGVALRLAAIRRMLEEDPGAAATAVEELQRVLASEQRSLRFFIQELRPSTATAPRADTLAVRLRDLGDLMELEWDLRVDLDVAAGAAALAPPVARDLYHIVREGLINAARHGAASHARVTIGVSDRDVTLTITDNGHGFPVSGHFSSEDLAARNLGPRSLRERVEAVHGGLTLESSTAGARLHVVLPLEGAA